MGEQPIKFVSKRELNDAQNKRVNIDHKASVRLNSNGQLEYLTEDIITPKGLTKTNKLAFIKPNPDEKVSNAEDVKYLFSQLAHMNIILTNACNLSCSYCYEQHNKDFGRFTEESLLKAYDFMWDNSEAGYRTFQFFGGEPLIHKDLILSFLKKNKEHLYDRAFNYGNRQVVSMITNGILLSPEFIQEYFSYDFTWMLVSLDTLDAEIDHRELTQDQINQIIESIKSIPEHAKNRVWTRCTISRETIKDLKAYIDKVYEIGVKSIIIHPLVLDSTAGFIHWNEEEWDIVRNSITTSLDQYDDLQISFSEGVGDKGENNCMIGSDMIAIDGSGDYSGCYFFTNQKANGADIAILGNVLNNTVYVERYKTFQKLFAQMFEEEEQCRTCDYKNKCYQCPAGNLDTGSKMFRPDSMCQNIVKLYVDLQKDVARKQYKNKFNSLLEQITSSKEPDGIISRNIVYLMYLMLSGKHPNHSFDAKFPEASHQEICALWIRIIKNGIKVDTSTFETFVNDLPYDCSESASVKDLYEFLLDDLELPKTKSLDVTNLTLQTTIGYLTLLHFLMINYKDKKFEGIFSKKLL